MTAAQQRRASFGGDAPRRAADGDQEPVNPTAVSEPAALIAATHQAAPLRSTQVGPDLVRVITDNHQSPNRSARASQGVGYPGAPRRDGSGRGRLVLPEKVVAKIASQAASEVSAVGGSSGGMLGIGSHADLNARPKADVELSGRTATIDVDLAVRYPTPIRQATERTRQHVMDRVHELTGVAVTRVDVTVVSLRTPDMTRREEGLR